MVPPHAASAATECDRNLQAVTDSLAQFRDAHPESPVTYTIDGIAKLTQSMPHCPEGGRYEFSQPGASVQTDGGADFVVTRHQVVGRCVHQDGSPFHRKFVLSG